MGVISLTSLKNGLCFGPIPTALMIADPAYLIGNMTRDAFPEIPITKMNLLESMERHRMIEWVPYLRSAREPEEQNLELLRDQNGEIFYRVCKPVEIGEELLIWFGKDYCKQIGVPDMKEFLDASNMHTEGDSSVFFCSDCGSKFIYLYPYICHKMFKCQYARSPATSASTQMHNNNNNNNVELDLSNTLLKTTNHHKDKLKRLYSNDCSTEDNQSSEFSSFSAFKKIPKLTTANNIFPPNDMLQMNSIVSTEQEAAILAPLLKNIAHYSNSFNLSPAMYNLMNDTQYLAPGLRPNAFLPYMPTTHYGAFSPAQYLQMVSKSMGLTSPGSAPQTAEYFPPPKIRTSVVDKTGRTSTSPAATNAQISPPQKVTNPMVEKLLQSAVHGESLVSNQSLGINQNWCAKCNATFRMTSDLVYHMRTHHQREDSGPVTPSGNSAETTDSSQQSRKRCDYLRCEICGETFRERHHLTRHMTSHD